MERYIGIDTHRDSSTICVLSASGKRVMQEVVATERVRFGQTPRVEDPQGLHRATRARSVTALEVEMGKRPELLRVCSHLQRSVHAALVAGNDTGIDGCTLEKVPVGSLGIFL